MSFRVHALGVMSDFVPVTVPHGGLLLGRDGRWVAIGPQGLLHMRWLESAPRWDRHGRVVYASVADVLCALDARSGTIIWEQELRDAPALLAAHANGVDLWSDGVLRRYSRYGRLEQEVPGIGPATTLCSGMTRSWIGGPEGVRCIEESRIREVCTGDCGGLFASSSGAWAWIRGGPSSLVHDDGAPLQWPMPDVPLDAVRPAGADTFWLLRAGVAPSIVDRRQAVRWSWSGAARLSAADGRFAVVVDERVWLVGPTAPALLLPVPGPDAVLAGDGIYAVVAGDDTHLFLVEETP